MPGWYDVPLADWLEAETGKPTVVGNDANCAGLGEAWLGAGRHYQNLILLTLGTGVGGAIILNGKLFVGHQGAGGELGLISFNPTGPYVRAVIKALWSNIPQPQQFVAALAKKRRNWVL